MHGQRLEQLKSATSKQSRNLLQCPVWLSLPLSGRWLTWEELHSSQCEVEASELAT